MADAGAIKPLVALLNEEDDSARKKAAGAIAALAAGSAENQVMRGPHPEAPRGPHADTPWGSAESQDTVEKNKGISKLVGLLRPTMHDEVSPMGPHPHGPWGLPTLTPRGAPPSR